MKDNLINRFWNGVGEKYFTNIVNKALLEFIGGQAAQYDQDAETYLKKGYKINPDIYSVITQMCDKTKSVPYSIKKVVDQKNYSKITSLRNATSGNYSVKQLVDKAILETKAYDDKEMPFPLDRPNPTQTWADIISLYKLFLKLTGNVYLFWISPENGMNAGTPQLLYILPSHKMKIILKKNADVLYDENPIDYYMMTEGDQTLKFPAENMIHIKTTNPFFDMEGTHLYGLSPISALLKNIESSNDALDNNVKTMKNSGIFGFITSKAQSSGNTVSFSSDQATQLKSKMVDMDNAKGRLSKIAALSVPVEFTKISVDTKDLMPFEYLKYDQKQICNVLGWSDALLNNDDGGKYDKQKEERKRVITDNIHPDLIQFQEAMTYGFIRKFKGYENCVWEFDVTELQEMQEDFKAMVEWMDKAPITPNEKRTALKYETLEIDGMDVPWMPAGLKRIDEVGVTNEDFEKAYKDII